MATLLQTPDVYKRRYLVDEDGITPFPSNNYGAIPTQRQRPHHLRIISFSDPTDELPILSGENFPAKKRFKSSLQLLKIGKKVGDRSPRSRARSSTDPTEDIQDTRQYYLQNNMNTQSMTNLPIISSQVNRRRERGRASTDPTDFDSAKWAPPAPTQHTRSSSLTNILTLKDCPSCALSCSNSTIPAFYATAPNSPARTPCTPHAPLGLSGGWQEVFNRELLASQQDSRGAVLKNKMKKLKQRVAKSSFDRLEEQYFGGSKARKYIPSVSSIQSFGHDETGFDREAWMGTPACGFVSGARFTTTAGSSTRKHWHSCPAVPKRDKWDTKETQLLIPRGWGPRG